MRARGYPLEYAAALGSGLWPSCDILPVHERGARGQALVPGRHVWPCSEESSQLDIDRMQAV
jgi:hypothetical protein